MGLTRGEAIKQRDSGVNAFYLINKIYDDFESRTCENCKHFTVDEMIDPNNHFGYCDTEKTKIDGILDIGFGCNIFSRKD